MVCLPPVLDFDRIIKTVVAAIRLGTMSASKPG
jgi:hypothetical protein